MIKTPKALFHPDGGLFVIWHHTQAAYSPVISDEDVPPRPGIDITFKDRSITAHEGLVWRPIRITAERSIIETEDVLTPYDPDTGEEY
jgi:hypothetical protein